MGVHAAHCSSSLYQSGSLALSMGMIRPESEKSSTLQHGSGKSLKAMAASGMSVVSEFNPTQIASGSILTVAVARGFKWWIEWSMRATSGRTVHCEIGLSLRTFTRGQSQQMIV